YLSLHVAKPDEFYRKFSNDSLYRDLIFALYGFAALCYLWATVGLIGCLLSWNWVKTQAVYHPHPKFDGEWKVLTFEKEGRVIPVTNLYFGGNPPPLGRGVTKFSTPMTVYYNPRRPDDNVVFRHPSWMTYGLLLVGSALLVVIPKLKANIAV
ncbi:MAG: hypothetical protein HC904_17505, partial [Blastochloris sp.]|nr:hypothetical protein [Blastochloris sp.]